MLYDQITLTAILGYLTALLEKFDTYGLAGAGFAGNVMLQLAMYD